jgi:hypothetical protein
MINTLLIEDVRENSIVTRRSILPKEKVTATKNPVTVATIPFGISMTIKIYRIRVPRLITDEE